MPRLSVIAALGAAAVAASLFVAVPAQAAPAPAAAACHDSATVRHAKQKERKALASAQSIWKLELPALKSVLAKDVATAQADHAKADSVPELLAYDDAKVARDKAEIASVKDAIAWAKTDSKALARCGAAGKRAMVRAAMHTIRLIRDVSIAELTADTTKLAYDQRSLADAQAAGNTTAVQAAQTAITDDNTAIETMKQLIASMDKAYAKLKHQG